MLQFFGIGQLCWDDEQAYRVGCDVSCGSKARFRLARAMSLMPSLATVKADVAHFAFVPTRDHAPRQTASYSITSSALPTGFSETLEHVGVFFWPKPGRAFADLKVEGVGRNRDGLF